MNTEDYNGNFEVGKDCLDADMKRERHMAKVRALENNPITNEEILIEAFERAEDNRFKGIIDPGSLFD